MLKKKRKILGDFNYFFHKKCSWKPQKNSEGFLFKVFFSDISDQVQHIGE